MFEETRTSDNRQSLSRQSPPATFADFGLSRGLLANLPTQWSVPRDIQVGCIPHILAGKDVVGYADTGSGKTAAFAIPTIELALRQSHQGVKILVILPTQELAEQVLGEYRQLAKGLPLEIGMVSGRTPLQSDAFYIERSKPDILIGTDGRIADLVSRRELSLSHLSTLVLDECDRTLNAVRNVRGGVIRGALPQTLQKLFFSATGARSGTLRTDISELAIDAVEVAIAANRPPDTISYETFAVEDNYGKFSALLSLLLSGKVEKALIFVKEKWVIDLCEKALLAANISVLATHQDRPTADRQRAISALKEGTIRYVLASDGLSVGTDVVGLPAVINYDLPASLTDFIQRAGRTGRSGEPGRVITLLTRLNVERLEAGAGTKKEYHLALKNFGAFDIKNPPEPEFPTEADRVTFNEAMDIIRSKLRR